MQRNGRDFVQLVSGGALFIFEKLSIARGQTARVVQGEELNMEIMRAGSQPSTKGPVDWFTGTVRIDPLFQPKEPARAAAASVTFEPGGAPHARSAIQA